MTHISDKATVAIPASMKNWNSRQIFDGLMAEINDDNRPINDMLCKVFDAICDPNEWKNAVYVRDPQIPIVWVSEALIHYHGRIPQILSDRGFYSKGYAC